MATIFTMIIDGDIPGRFVWKDDVCVAFLSINPLSEGHTLVVPRAEVDHWLDLDEATWAHLSEVARLVGKGIAAAFDPPRVGVIVAGFEVPHVHVHVLGADGLANFDFRTAATEVDGDAMDAAAEAIRAALRAQGHDATVPNA